jgi:hypothetical protein
MNIENGVPTINIAQNVPLHIPRPRWNIHEINDTDDDD